MDPAKRKAYRQATVRLTKSNRPRKSRAKVSVVQLEAWIEANAERFWHKRGRPPAGCLPLSAAACAAFNITTKTFDRALKRINTQRRRINVAAQSNPIVAAMGAAMMAAYKNRTISTTINQTMPVNKPLIQSNKGLIAQSLKNQPPILTPIINEQAIRSSLLTALRSTTDLDLLDEIHQVLDERRRPLKSPATTPSSPLPGARGLEAIGLYPVAPKPNPAPPRAPVAGRQTSPEGIVVEGLMDSLDAWLGTVAATHPLRAVVERLRSALKERR